MKLILLIDKRGFIWTSIIVFVVEPVAWGKKEAGSKKKKKTKKIGF